MTFSLSDAITAAVWLINAIGPLLMIAIGTSAGAAVLLWIMRGIPDLGDILK
jgi:hypothetical protein